MNLKNVSTGGGLALLAVAVLANAGASLLSTFSPQAHADATAASRAVVASAMAQGGGEPTIVWYGVTPPMSFSGYVGYGYVFRAWSDGRIEAKRYIPDNYYAAPGGCAQIPFEVNCDWVPFSNTNDGLAAFADLNADEKVDALDLGSVLSRWGDAPRNAIPPSECPLNLINP
jgi:hypothetical protein